eukprot:352737-Chlamydomonas_euryale.AAC.1
MRTWPKSWPSDVTRSCKVDMPHARLPLLDQMDMNNTNGAGLKPACLCTSWDACALLFLDNLLAGCVVALHFSCVAAYRLARLHPLLPPNAPCTPGLPL